MAKNKRKIYIPTKEELEEALTKEKYKLKYRKTLKSTIYSLIIVISVSSLLSTLLFPVLEIYGKSMNPTLSEGNIVLSFRKTNLKRGDIIAFYHNNKILIKRVIGVPSDWINIDKEGNVYVNNTLLEESYLKEKYKGESNIKYPYQVPEDTYFVLGDDRPSSIDSRVKEIGTIHKDNVIGKIIFRLWPIKEIGLLK